MIDPERSSFQRDEDEAAAAPDDEYVPDPDAPTTDEGKQQLAEKELDAVTKLALSIAALATGLALVVGSASFGKGVLLGSIAAVVNLRVLAKAGWGLLSGKAKGGSVLVGFLASFGFLIAASAFVAFVKPDWVLGFGAGLALPALVGVVWATTRK